MQSAIDPLAWLTRLNGPHACLFVYALVAAPLLAGLLRRRAPGMKILMFPALAVPVASNGSLKVTRRPGPRNRLPERGRAERNRRIKSSWRTMTSRSNSGGYPPLPPRSRSSILLARPARSASEAPLRGARRHRRRPPMVFLRRAPRGKFARARSHGLSASRAIRGLDSDARGHWVDSKAELAA